MHIYVFSLDKSAKTKTGGSLPLLSCGLLKRVTDLGFSGAALLSAPLPRPGVGNWNPESESGGQRKQGYSAPRAAAADNSRAAVRPGGDLGAGERPPGSSTAELGRATVRRARPPKSQRQTDAGRGPAGLDARQRPGPCGEAAERPRARLPEPGPQPASLP